MAFVFSLAAVLAVRRRREEAEERALAQTVSEISIAGQALRRIEGEVDRLAVEHALEAPRRRPATDLHERYARIALLQHAQSDARAYMAELTARREAQQQSYLEARRERELLEKMEATQRAAWAGRLARVETRNNEDIFLARSLRR